MGEVREDIEPGLSPREEEIQWEQRITEAYASNPKFATLLLAIANGLVTSEQVRKIIEREEVGGRTPLN